MTERAKTTSLATVAILILLTCLAGATGIAIVAVQFTKWDVLSGLFAAVLAVIVTVIIGMILDATERWLDGAQSNAPVERDRP